MLKSKLILDIFNLIIDEHEYEDLLRKQMNFLTEGRVDHTGAGLFLYFDVDEEIYTYKVPTYQLNSFDGEGNSIMMINGIELSNETLKIQADTSVHVKNGIINCLEIWN